VAGAKTLGVALLALAVIAATAWASGGGAIVRTVAVAPLVLFLPGALLVSLVAPRRPFTFEFCVLALGASLAADIVVGLVLHGVGALNPTGWGAAATIMAAGALWRNRRSLASFARRGAPFASLLTRENGLRMAALAVVAALATSSVALASYGARQHRPFAYTELWLQPFDGASPQRVLVGVRNQEEATVRYGLELLLNDRTLVRWPQFDLANGQQRVEDVPVQVALPPEGRLEARLYRLDEPNLVYRRAWLSAPAQGE
jgi:uncharacterized membrane protein